MRLLIDIAADGFGGIGEFVQGRCQDKPKLVQVIDRQTLKDILYLGVGEDRERHGAPAGEGTGGNSAFKGTSLTRDPGAQSGDLEKQSLVAHGGGRRI